MKCQQDSLALSRYGGMKLKDFVEDTSLQEANNFYPILINPKSKREVTEYIRKNVLPSIYVKERRKNPAAANILYIVLENGDLLIGNPYDHTLSGIMQIAQKSYDEKIKSAHRGKLTYGMKHQKFHPERGKRIPKSERLEKLMQ